jgi:hypothetical protein
MIGNGGGFSAGATGGSADAIVVSHNHTATVTDPGHNHQIGGTNTSGGVLTLADRNGDGSSNTYDTTTKTTGITVTNTATGSSGTNANLPPYIVIYAWNRTA